MRPNRMPGLGATLLSALLLLAPAALLNAQQRTRPGAAGAAASDPLLRALETELARSKAQLKLDGISEPYYIEYRVFDVDQFEASAAFGSLRDQSRTRMRLLRASVRVGGYQIDSYYGPGQGVSDVLPLDNDELALRHQIWLATDQAYKRAGEALAAKHALLRQLNVENPVNDFSKAAAVRSIGPAAKLEVDPSHWTAMLESATALYKTDPEIQSFDAELSFLALTSYFVNTDGTVLRRPSTHYLLTLSATEQAPDGMRLTRSPEYASSRIEDMPTPEALQRDAAALVAQMKQLRTAPVVEENYRGPVLFSSDAAADVFYALIATNVLGKRPEPGRPARTVGAFASSLKGRVLPTFLSIVDDPTVDKVGGKALTGSYQVDDEGVPASPVTVVDKGILINYLLGRQPIRDFPESNGHGRASGNGTTNPAPGNLFIRAEHTRTRDELRKQMMEICRERGLPYGYFVDTLGPRLTPRALYRLWAADGREELVRGAVFNELDARALRNDLLAVGDDAAASNRSGIPPASIVSPSILFDELEVRRADNSREKLPDYPPPELSTGR